MLNSALCCWNLRLQPMHVIIACGIFHISWSHRVGSFPWRFAVHSLHFTQQLILFSCCSQGCVLLPHLRWGSGRAPLALSVLGITRRKGNLWLQRSWPVTVHTMRSQNGFLVSSCHLLWEWPPRTELSVTLQQRWLIALLQKTESREKLKTGEGFMSQVCPCCFNHSLQQENLMLQDPWNS